jgi:hypothetical protein
MKDRKNSLDLPNIEFNEADIRSIEIPRTIDRDEDKVLAYCHKYWSRIDDQDFEKTISLYSKKYETKHFSVFQAIQSGRQRKVPDNDILTTVATIIATGYSYTVQGDLYMQAAWRRIKTSLNTQAPVAMPTPVIKVHAAKPATTRGRSAPRPKEKDLEPRNRASMPATLKSQATIPVSTSASRKILVAVPGKKKKTTPPPTVPPASKSISDSIKKLSGRAYDVYKSIFLSNVRGHIRNELLKNRLKPGGVFNDDTNKAENHVYDFMERNYANAYMDWASSEHRTRILELGFDLRSLDEIIKACYRKIEA